MFKDFRLEDIVRNVGVGLLIVLVWCNYEDIGIENAIHRIVGANKSGFAPVDRVNLNELIMLLVIIFVLSYISYNAYRVVYNKAILPVRDFFINLMGRENYRTRLKSMLNGRECCTRGGCKKIKTKDAEYFFYIVKDYYYEVKGEDSHWSSWAAGIHLMYQSFFVFLVFSVLSFFSSKGAGPYIYGGIALMFIFFALVADDEFEYRELLILKSIDENKITYMHNKIFCKIKRKVHNSGQLDFGG